MSVNIGKKITFKKDMWDRIELEASKCCVTPQQWLINGVVRLLEQNNVVPPKTAVLVPTPTPTPTQPQITPQSPGPEEYSPLLGDIPEIRKWQRALKEAEYEYDGYRHGVAEEDWELEQKSDYVVAVAERIAEAQEKLRQLIPVIPE